jgi:peptidoglycan/xylan/chitin deacetylase (PgdA/CDA1 family)
VNISAPRGMAVAVVVRSHRRATTVDSCLAALRREMVEPVIVDVRACRTIAQARNEALAATDAGVLAFVDDDIAVRPGWREALLRAWSRAPRDCACIGGPIDAMYVGDRPEWLTDAMAGVLGVSAGGATFHGGNVSFRTTALRGIGGFWPMRGREELYDWFSEEHYAQEQLIEAGWTIAGEPTAAADRIILGAELGPLDLFARRARYGARAARASDRGGRAMAARTLARSAAGAALAATRRDRVRATERAARAAQSAGVLIAPLLARHDLEATADETPFLYSVQRPTARSRPRPRRSIAPLILAYHRVDDQSGVAPAHFAQHMEVLTACRTPATLEAIVACDAPRDAAAVTFDDGYHETIQNVRPVLAATGMPATVFVTTGHVRTGRAFWWDVVERLLRSAGTASVRLTVDGETRGWARADRARRHVVAWLQPKSPTTIAAAVEALARDLGGSEDALPNERPLTVDDVRALGATDGIAFGSHTREHANLRHIDAVHRRDELVGSREDLAEWLGCDPPAGFAYPYGVPGADLDDETQEAVRSAGYSFAVATAAGAVTRWTDRFALPRVAPPEAGADAFRRMLRVYGTRA